MKKSIALLLALVMCLPLCACGNDTGLSKADFVGTWINVNSCFEMVLNKDGTGSQGSAPVKNWKYNRKTNQITAGYATYNVVDNNGVIELWEVYEDGIAHYPSMKSEDLAQRITKVEITLDNWQDYFELVYEPVWKKNDFGEVVKFYPVVRLQVKDELFVYKDPEGASYGFKFVPYDEYDVIFEISYKHNMKECQVDFENLKYVWGEHLDDYEITEHTVTASLIEQGEALGEQGVLQVYSQTYYSDETIDNAQVDIVDYHVTRVQGHLYIFE